MAVPDKLIKLEQLHKENQLEIDLLKQQMSFVMEFLKEQFGIKFEINNHQSVPKIIKIKSSAKIGMENVGNNCQESHEFQADKDRLLFGQYFAGIQSVQCDLVNHDNEVLATEIGNPSVGFGLENLNDTIDIDSATDQNSHEEIEDDDNEDYLDDDSLSAVESISCKTGSKPSTSQIEEMENDEEKNAGNDDLPDFEKNQPDMRSESNQTKTRSVRNPYICDWKNCGKRFTRRDGLNCHSS